MSSVGRPHSGHGTSSGQYGGRDTVTRQPKQTHAAMLIRTSDLARNDAASITACGAIPAGRNRSSSPRFVHGGFSDTLRCIASSAEHEPERRSLDSCLARINPQADNSLWSGFRENAVAMSGHSEVALLT
jgi:hypothetical protein